MKIVSTTNQLNMDGLGAAFQASGIDFLFWNSAQKALLDMCHEVKPDIIFLTPNIVQANQKAIEIALQKYPKMIWWNLAVNTIKPRANLAQYGGGIKQTQYECEYGMFTYNFQPSKLEVFMQKKFKAWGNKLLPIPNYVGELKQNERKNAIASSICFVCHTQEETFNALLNKSRPIIFLNDEIHEVAIEEDTFSKVVNHTYFQEAAEILTTLHFTTEAELCLKTHSKLSEKLL